MDLLSFTESLQGNTPPHGVSEYLRALWYDAKGEWEEAHKIIQDIDTATASWIHAYLHRKEGDTVNADYWYRKSGKKRPVVSLEAEWKEIVTALI